MTLADLDPVVHAPKRLAIMSGLANSVSTDFPFLRDHLGISDSDLSKQMSALMSAGYVSSTKSRGRGGVTTYRITRRGSAAFHKHAAALRLLVGDPVDQA